ncbi:hypothetical protein RHMOL_Rhmol09G0151200 [Rhododendron molle]|uniref:Uncharacterized protein n=1 Tax=Rhododendron molle TaxID=49168 RepID=A0ACC0MDE1_RHOML|nr:hypothetical protein RHMOL_Rhmol09G0151200 [Rhododendron molle]
MHNILWAVGGGGAAAIAGGFTHEAFINEAFLRMIAAEQDDKDSDFLPRLCKLLETWLMEVVFPRFRDTNNITFKLGDYYDDPTVLRYLESLDGVGGSPTHWLLQLLL